MTRSTIAGSTLGTVALGILLVQTAAPPSVSLAAPTGATSQASSTSASVTTKMIRKGSWLRDDGPWKASQAHFAGFFPGTECPPKKERWCIPDNEPVAAMIALAPDPLHSHMALGFDRAVEAIKLAAQSAKYVIDRYWLPWDISSKTDWADYDSLQQATGDQKQKERQPGLLLFRWDGEQEEQKRQERPTVLYVFLVTDTSTAGINGEQFRNAVKYVNEVCEKTTGSTGGCASSDTIHIMGPTFSGSLASLRRLVEANSPRNFAVNSGTVSSLCAQKNQRLLNSPDLLTQAAWLCDQDKDLHNAVDLQAFPRRDETFSSLCGSNNQHTSQRQDPSREAALLCQHYKGYEPAQHLRFHSLVTSTESAVNRFIESLQQDGDIKCDEALEVAILSEAATTYGGSARTIEKGDLSTNRDQRDCSYITFSYPREIASLRNASQLAAKAGQSAASNPAVATPYLPLNLADQTNRSDESPDFSTLQGPLSKEAVLMNFAAALRRDHYKYIGISGSNILDVLFLATFLRKAVPDARLFLVDSDLLLERDLDNAPYIGTLAIATYPLILRDLDWTSPKRHLTRLPFADQYEEGEFNAALLTMQEILPIDSKGGEVLYECGDQTCSPQTLPLWLTAVGTAGYWPVRMLTGRSPAGEGPALTRRDFSGAWTVISIFLCSLGLLHCGVLLRVWPLSSSFRDFSLLNAESGQRLFFIHTASASLALGLAMTGAPAWKLRPWPSVGIIIVITIAGLLLTCVLLEINYLMSPSRASRRRLLLLQIFSSVGVWGVAALLALGWETLFADDVSHYGLFFSYRTLHPATGVSPLTPMLPLLAAIYFWAIGEVWRLHFNDQTRPRLIPGGTADDAADDKSHSESEEPKLRPGMQREGLIANSISKYLLGPPYVVCFLLIFVVWFLFFDPCHAFELFERRFFGTLYEILFCLVVAMILSTGFRMSQIWLELKGLLLELNRSLVRFTFFPVKDYGWSSLWRPGSDEVEWNYMVHSMELIRQLGRGDGELAKRLKAEAAKITATVVDIRTTRQQLQNRLVLLPAVCTTLEYAGLVTSQKKRMAVDCRHLYACVRQIQDHLARILAKVLDILQESWAERFPAPKHDSEPERNLHPVIVYCCERQRENQRVVAYHYEEEIDSKAEQQSLLERYAALRYVSFIRAVLGRIRFALIFLAISFSLLLISLNVYSFEPHQALIWSLTAIFFVIGFVSVVVMMQAHRDPVLSSITGTQPNRLEPAFYIRIFALGAVPLFTLLSTHFPAIGRSLVSFVQPGLEALK